MLEIAKECNITFQRGDILFVRTGVIKEWEQDMDVEAKKAYASSTNPQHAGVEGTLDVLQWVWNTGFAAVAGDAISWEVRHAVQDGRSEADQRTGVSPTSRNHLDARVHARRMGNAHR